MFYSTHTETSLRNLKYLDQTAIENFESENLSKNIKKKRSITAKLLQTSLKTNAKNKKKL